MKPAEANRTGRILRFAQYAFAALGVLALGYCVAAYVNARLFQAKAARNFQRAAARGAPPSPAPAPPVAPPPPREGAVLGRLRVPRLGLAVMVVEGADAGDLKRAAGHIPGTALPGESGNIGIAGHRDTFFRPLRNIRPGDLITLSTLHGDCHYKVVSTRVVSPDDVAVLYPNGSDCLTLVTCFPFDYIGSAPRRFIVRAEKTA